MTFSTKEIIFIFIGKIIDVVVYKIYDKLKNMLLQFLFYFGDDFYVIIMKRF